MTDNKLRHAIGGLLLLIGLITYGYSGLPLLTTLSWALMAAGAYLITQALFAILFTVFALCIALYFTGQAKDPTTLILMIASGCASIYFLVTRFGERIRETRNARWKKRQKQDETD